MDYTRKNGPADTNNGPAKAAKGTLSGDGKPKHHEAHIRKLHDGYHVEKHHADGAKTEHSAGDLDEAIGHIQDHMEQGDEPETENPEGASDQAQAAPPAQASA